MAATVLVGISPAVAKAASGTHYIEFRSRVAGSYTGHTYAVYGRLGSGGRLASKNYVGLHPAQDSDVNLLVLGHFVSVRAITKAVKDDKVDAYVTSRFRVDMTAREYAKVVAHIEHLKTTTTTWHAALNNCNDFVGRIARFMGYKTPDNAFTDPETYVDSIRSLNQGQAIARHAMGTSREVSKTVSVRR